MHPSSPNVQIRWGTWFVLFVAITICASQLSARVKQLIVTKVESPTFGGANFGSVGQYELIQGTITGEVDPTNPQNSVIVDITNAPRSQGMVSYTSDFQIIRPINLAHGNHRILFDLPNRWDAICHESF